MALGIAKVSWGSGRGVAYKTKFTTQPDGGVTGATFTTQPVVRVVDRYGVLVPSFTGNITLSIYGGSGTIGGTVTVAASGGIATFTNVQITGTGPHVLAAAGSGLVSGRSMMMTVNAAAQAAKTVLVTGANTTDKVDCGSGSTLDNLTASDMTWIGRIKRTGTGSNQFVCAKYDGTGGWYVQIATDYGEGTVVASTKCATSDAFAYTNASNLLAQDTWYDVAAVWTFSTRSWKLYRATPGTALAEISGYGTGGAGSTAAGSGSVGSDAASTLQIGNLPLVPTNPFKGHSEWQGVWNSALTTAQMLTIQQAFDLSDTTRAVAMATSVSGCKGLWKLDGTSSRTDHSGNSNTGTVTGCSTTTGETVLTPTVWGNSTAATDQTAYLQPTSHAQVKFTTSATSVIAGVNRTSDLSSTYDNQAALPVEVAGAYDSQIVATTAGTKQYVTRSLPAGTNKAVSILNSLHTRNGSVGTGTDAAGVSLVSLRFNASATEVIPPTPSAHVVFLHDSIIDGFMTNPVGSNGPINKLRQYCAGNPQITSLGYGGNSLYKLAVDGTARTATVNALKPLNPTTIVIALGTNDYSGNLWTAASYGSALGSLVDAIIAEFPDCLIRVLTPATLPSGESANGGGSTLGNYRTQATTACAGKTNTRVHAGPTEVWDGTNADADNTHPNNTGAAAILANLKTILGV